MCALCVDCAPVGASPSVLQAHVLRVGTHLLGIPSASVECGGPYIDRHPARRGEGPIVGVAQHGGETVPILDLCWLLGVPTSGRSASVLMVRGSGGHIAVLADGFVGDRPLPPARLREAKAPTSGLSTGAVERAIDLGLVANVVESRTGGIPLLPLLDPGALVKLCRELVG